MRNLCYYLRMNAISHAISEIKSIDELANRDQWVNRIHPLVKFACTVLYIALVVSFSKYDLTGLLAMGLYPLAMFSLADLSFMRCVSRLKVVLPLVCMVGLFNPFFDKTPVLFLGFTVRAGVISMLTLILKGFFALLASYILIATTTIEKICYALRLLFVPKILVTEVLLIYRYITLLLAETERITQAYALRAPGQKGVHFRVWGSLAGLLLLRSMDRAGEVYESMSLRGYSGDFQYMADKTPLRAGDLLFGAVWIALFVLFRSVPVLTLVGNLFVR